MGQTKLCDLQTLGPEPSNAPKLELWTDSEVGFVVVDSNGTQWTIGDREVFLRVASYIRSDKSRELNLQEAHEVLECTYKPGFMSRPPGA